MRGTNVKKATSKAALSKGLAESPGVSSNSSLATSSLTTSCVSSPQSVGSRPSVAKELFSRRLDSGFISESSKRNKLNNDQKAVFLWSIMHNGRRCGLSGDGLYAMSEFLTGQLTGNDLQLLSPYSENILQTLVVPGGLLKAYEACNILNDRPKEEVETSTTRQELSYLEKNGPYLFSQTGKKHGSSKVWLFSQLQVMEKWENSEVEFDEAVFDIIVNFLTQTKRTCDKDNQNKLRIPANRDEAMDLFNKSPAWNVVHKTFDLDSDEKIDVFDKLSSSF